MESRSKVHAAIASILRAVSLAAFVAEAMALAATSIHADWAGYPHFGLGWSAWMGLSSLAAMLAFAGFVVWALWAVLYFSGDREPLGRARRCPWLNLATIGLMLFVPAIAVSDAAEARARFESRAPAIHP